MSMFGSVTDAQVFSRELTDKEMMDITGCRLVASYTSHLTPHTSLMSLPGTSSLATFSAGTPPLGTSPPLGTPQKWKF